MTSVSTIKNRIATAAALATFGLAALAGALAGPANADAGAAASVGSESSSVSADNTGQKGAESATAIAKTLGDQSAATTSQNVKAGAVAGTASQSVIAQRGDLVADSYARIAEAEINDAAKQAISTSISVGSR